MAAAYRDVVSLPSASSVSGAGQTTWKLTGTAVPPRFSVQLGSPSPVRYPPHCSRQWSTADGAGSMAVTVWPKKPGRA